MWVTAAVSWAVNSARIVSGRLDIILLHWHNGHKIFNFGFSIV